MWKQIQNVEKNKDKLWIKSMIWFDKYWGCHQMPQRSFFIKGYQLPICARCCGILTGYIIGFILFIFKIKFNILISFILMFSTLIDWLLQFFNILKSTNTRRLITGTLGGIGIIEFLYYILKLLIYN